MGDLAFTFADAALADAGLPVDRLAAGLRVFNRLRSEMMGGQYLDLVESRRGSPTEAAVRRILAYKSGKYTIERPLHLGAALAGGGPGAVAAYSAYGLPLGEAYQLRDDVLGVFGTPEVTGKPVGDDLREGKETWLIARTRALAGAPGRRLLDELLGDPGLTGAEVDRLRDVIAGCGALAETEARIAHLLAQAKAAVTGAAGSPVGAEARRVLTDLAGYVTDRSA
jgi:geranylgeranyl diphosphate synthase type I